MNDTNRLVATLERQLQGLILEWERFFSGDRRLPPHLERTRLERRIRQLQEVGDLRGGARFRLDQLQHRFSTYAALWERQLRQREEGRRVGALAGRRIETIGRSAVVESGPNERVSASVESSEGAGLYDRWMEAKREVGSGAGMSREQFEAKLEKQRRELEGRLGQKVEFDVTVREGRVKLTARATKKEKGGGE